jgi:hypothetical protein
MLEDVLDRPQRVDRGVEEGEQVRDDDVVVVRHAIAVRRVRRAKILDLLIQEANQPSADALFFVEIDVAQAVGAFGASGFFRLGARNVAGGVVRLVGRNVRASRFIRFTRPADCKAYLRAWRKINIL